MKTLRFAVITAALFSVLAATGGRGQDPGATAPLDAATKSRVIQKLAQVLNEKYVDAAKGKMVGDHVLKSLAGGTFDAAANPAAFAEAVTADLQSLSVDRHFRVGFDQRMFEMLSDTTGPPEEMPPEEIKRRARDNFGFEKAEILMGNVGHLDLRAFEPPAFAGATAVAAMSFLANCDALIIDLRSNGGGTPEMIQLITSYLFEGERQHLNDFYVREGDTTNQFWTLPYVPGSRLAKVPVFVLTSKRTFSAAEEFTYDLKNLKRGTIIGETTGGGAHPGGFFPLEAGFVTFVSTGKAVNPVTHTNWEGVGVKPDIEVPQEDALKRAHAEALKAIMADETDPERKTSLLWSVESIESEIHPSVLKQSEMRAYTGVYGIRKILLDGDTLYFQREEQPRFRLIPLGNDMFRGESMDDLRLRFSRDNQGRVAELTGLRPSGPFFTAKRAN
jgi:retinol-binding protein 3